MENSNKKKFGIGLIIFGLVLILVIGVSFYMKNKALREDQHATEDFINTLTENEPAFDRFCAYPLWEDQLQGEGGSITDIQRSANRVEEKLEKTKEPLALIKGKKF